MARLVRATHIRCERPFRLGRRSPRLWITRAREARLYSPLRRAPRCGRLQRRASPREAHVPAERPPPEAQARVSCAHVHPRRAARFSSAAAPRAGSGSPPERCAVERRQRLSRSRDFDAVYRHGRSVSTRLLVSTGSPATRTADGEPRLGLAIPRAVGSARRPQPCQAPAACGLGRARRRDVPAGQRLRPGRAAGPRRAGRKRAGTNGSSSRCARCSARCTREVRSGSRSSTPGATRFGLLTPAGTCKYHPSCSQYALDALRELRARPGHRARRLAPPALQPVEPRRRRPRRGADALRPARAEAGARDRLVSILRPIEDILPRS